MSFYRRKIPFSVCKENRTVADAAFLKGERTARFCIYNAYFVFRNAPGKRRIGNRKKFSAGRKAEAGNILLRTQSFCAGQ